MSRSERHAVALRTIEEAVEMHQSIVRCETTECDLVQR